MSYRSGRTLFPPPSSSGASVLPSALEPDGGSKDSVRLPPSKEVKSQMKVGDHVCARKRNMGSCHLPCRIIGGFGGCYQLYCSKGVLNTSFCGTELIPLASCSPIPLENWRLSPKLSLRSVVSDPALVECCYCQVQSQTGWLTDKIICAAQMLLLQFFPNMEGLQPPTLQKVFAFQVHCGEFIQIIHVRKSHWCVVSTVGCESGVVHVYDSFYRAVNKETVRLIASMVYSPSSELKTRSRWAEAQCWQSLCRD